MVSENPGQAKGARRANEVRKARTKGRLFFLQCLNSQAQVSEFYRNYHFKHLPYDYRHKRVKAFETLPHCPDGFQGMMNSYRAMRILQILGENVNRGHLKQFSESPTQGGKIGQNKQACQDMLKLIESNKRAYKQVLKLFAEAFVQELKLGWADTSTDQDKPPP